MQNQSPDLYDVVIAGAGPVGLFLACELRLAGLSVLVLEQAQDPHSALKQLPFGLRGLSIPTLEAFHRRCLLDEIVAAQRERSGAIKSAAHWMQQTRRPAGHFAGIQFYQDDIDASKWSWRLPTPADANVAVDTDPELTGYSVDVELADPDKLGPGRNYTPAGMYTYTQPGTIAMVDFDGGAFHRTEPITREHVQRVLRRVSCTDVTLMVLRLAATWTDRAHQATTYRKGRVFLAGDAAHIHSPLGGQGLNLGLGDAMNLGWKLAAAIRGHAPADLLDTYSCERHPVGAQVLDWSRAQVAIMRPTPSSRALQAIIRDLIETGDGAAYFAERVRGVSLRYDLGGSHPLVGRSVPDFELLDGTTVGALLRPAKGILLDFGTRASLQALASRWSDRITYVAGEPKDRLGLSAALVRPDGFVVWAADGVPEYEEAAQVTSRWFGQPTGSGFL